MARNPKWWKDSDAPEAEAPAPTAEFDPASYDGQQVDDSLNHSKLDAVIAHRGLDASSLPSDATKAQKVTFINEASLV